MLSLVMMLSGCCKPEIVTRTETVEVYVPQYRDYDFSTVECEQVKAQYGDKWLDALFSRDEMIDKCIASIETIERTLNHQQ